jgi:hypothetical protein
MRPHLYSLPKGEDVFPFSLSEKVGMRGLVVGIRRATFRTEGKIQVARCVLQRGGRTHE